MKILMITPSFFPASYYGGPIYSTYNFTKALAALGIKVDVITTNANGKEKLDVITGKFVYDSTNLRIKYYHSLDSRSTSIGMLTSLYKHIKISDVIYTVAIFSPPTPFTVFLANIMNKPLIISPRGSLGNWCLNQGNLLKKVWLKLFINPFAKKMYWHVTSLNEEMVIKKLYPNAKTILLHNGIDVNEFNKLSNKKNKKYFDKYTGFDCSVKKVVISMGRLHKVKGFDILISAFAKLQKTMNDIVLLIAGEDFGEKLNLEKIISKYDLTHKVFLVGRLEGTEKFEFLHNADLFALASHNENFGLVYAEALAAGTPIIASKHTPWQDAEKLNFGKWVENTPDAFTEAMFQILSSNYKYSGEVCKSYVERKFSWPNIAQQFISKIEKI